VLLLLKETTIANHLALLKKGCWLKNEPKKKTKEIQEEEEPDEEQDKQKNEEGVLKDDKPEN
jgi:hypothetical protein